MDKKSFFITFTHFRFFHLSDILRMDSSPNDRRVGSFIQQLSQSWKGKPRGWHLDIVVYYSGESKGYLVPTSSNRPSSLRCSKYKCIQCPCISIFMCVTCICMSCVHACGSPSLTIAVCVLIPLHTCPHTTICVRRCRRWTSPRMKVWG